MTPRLIFEQELESLKCAVTEISERAEISYNKLILAASKNDVESLKRLLDADREIVNMQRNIEATCLYLLTKQQPVARDLRIVSAALKVVTDIERIGDHVTDMAELFLRMNPPYNEKDSLLLKEMMDAAKGMVHDAVTAFVDMDVEKAKAVIQKDDVVDDYFNRIKAMLVDGSKNSAFGLDGIVDFLLLAKYVEKIADHAVNISEWAIFRATGNLQENRLL